MSEFKIGCSPLTSRIFAGNVLKDGTWGKTKHDVTETAPAVVAQHLIQLDESIEFTNSMDGKKYKLQVVEVKND